MATLARIHCYFGRHVRSRGRARRTPDGWRSYCRRCGVPMVKDEGGEWRLADEPVADATEAVGDAIGPDNSPPPARRRRFIRRSLFRLRRARPESS